MGWGSGVYIFDDIVRELLKDEFDKKNIIKTLKETLEERDCDTLYESEYLGNPLVREVFMEDKDWVEYFKEVGDE